MKSRLYVWTKGFLAFALLLTVAVGAAWAQDRRVSGKVTGPDGPVPGVNVTLKGTTIGATTNASGDYNIVLRGENPTLVISAIGYKTQEITVGNQTTVNATLEEDALALGEVVVTGYTTDNRRETTGAVSTVKAQDLRVTPTGNVEQQLQGRVPGLTVVTNGQPGTTSQVRVRGFGAFGGNTPLIVVDGVPVGNSDFLAPDDIETTTVLKDAAASSIYGARAANGVIVYTTKKGSRSARRLTVSYDGQYGVTNPGRGPETLAPTEFAEWTWQQFRNTALNSPTVEGATPRYEHPQFGKGSTPVIPDYINVGGAAGVVGTVDLNAERAKYNVNPALGPIYQVVRANKAGTDWYGAITRVAPVQRHGLGFQGGTEASRYYFGFSLQDQKGILLNNSFKRYTFRANSEFDLTKRLRIGENIQLTYRSVLGQGGEDGGAGVSDDENDFNLAYRMPSIIPIYDEFGGYAGTAAKGFNNPRNPVAGRDGQVNNRDFNGNIFGNIYAEFDLIPGLTLRTSLGGQYNNFYGRGYSRLQYENSENNSAFGFNEYAGYSFAWTVTNTAQYKRQFGQHRIDVLLGQEALNTGLGRFLNGNGQNPNPISTDPNYLTLTNITDGARQVNSGLFNGVNFYSLFGRVNYIFNDKYILTGLVRRDGSSRFGPNNRYGVFPAASAAWRVSAEEFMRDLPFITDLKIRGGYGIMGNSNNIASDNQFSLYAPNLGNAAYPISGSQSSVATGYYRTRIGNPDGKWETSVTSNFGFDGTFFNGKLDVVFDLWRKDTRDLIFRLAVPDVVGTYATAPDVNLASMRNQGIDILVTNRGQIGGSKVGYEITATGSFLKNEITGLDPNGPDYITYINPGFRGINPIRNQIGRPISSFFGYQVLGLFQTQAEIDAAPQQDGVFRTQDVAALPAADRANARPYGVGRFRYADVSGPDGVPDGKITADDRTWLGSPVPKFTGGLNFRFTFAGFDIETYLYTSLGNKIWNQSKWFTDFYPSFAGAAISARVRNSWTPDNRDTDIPIFEAASNASTNAQANSYYVEDGSYLRMQNLQLGYNIPASTVSRLGLQRVRLFASVNNLFTLTKYQGLDPGVGGNVDTNFGIDVGNYPVTRSFLFGLSLGF
jgi:TonB-linked SusC/RagA family outer membrane protein